MNLLLNYIYSFDFFDSGNSPQCELFPGSKIIYNTYLLQKEMHCPVPNTQDGPKKVASRSQLYCSTDCAKILWLKLDNNWYLFYCYQNTQIKMIS